MARRLKLIRKRQLLFLDHLRKSGNVSAAARVCECSQTQCYEVRKRDAQFRLEWSEAEADFYNNAETVLLKRALEGQRKSKIKVKTDAEGKPIERIEETVTDYSDANLQFFLRNRHPAYRKDELPNLDRFTATQHKADEEASNTPLSAMDTSQLTGDELLMLDSLLEKIAPSEQQEPSLEDVKYLNGNV